MWQRLLASEWQHIIIMAIDLILVAFLLYRVLALFAGTRAMAVINGLITLMVATILARVLGLSTLDWLLQKAMTAVLVGLPIVFQPELRRGLERLGAHETLTRWLPWLRSKPQPLPAQYIVEAAFSLSQRHIGALIVIRGQMSLSDVLETGVPLDASLSSELLCQIFIPNSPLHDGAVIVSGDRVVSAACVLPLSANNDIAKDLGTRHRAALGLAELTDAKAIVVSEETGQVSLAQSGRLEGMPDASALQKALYGGAVPAVTRPRILSWRTQAGGGKR